MIATEIEERFWNKVREADNGCWIWRAAQTGNGYGCFDTGKQGTRRAHRTAYELVVGVVSDGKVVHHRCRNRLCVNPQHLEVRTQRENVLLGEGLTAQNARKTHCPRGHLLAGSNLSQYA